MNDHLTRAAINVGITREQAVALLDQLMIPSWRQTQAGNEFRSIGTFQDPVPGYENLTWGEWNHAIAARHWIAMVSALIVEVDDKTYDGPIDLTIPSAIIGTDSNLLE